MQAKMTQKWFLPGVSSHAITIKGAMKSKSLSSTLLVRRGLSGKFHTICYIGWPISKNDSVVKKSWLKSIWYKKWKPPRPWKNNIVWRNGLIKCNQCNTLWNRDLNGALNIYEIANCHVRGLGRPEHLTNQN